MLNNTMKAQTVGTLACITGLTPYTVEKVVDAIREMDRRPEFTYEYIRSVSDLAFCTFNAAGLVVQAVL